MWGMESHSGHVVTLANSIIGVSILAMPYCFKQCGILLAVIILLFSNLISRLSCHFLIKSAIIARRKTFEYLAYYIFGGFGKFAIEVGLIGFLIGTCVAFFVVMGDLGPEIISEITGQDTTRTMRSTILLALALFCVLPLGLLKNISSLTGVSKATIGFYICLVMKIAIDALPHIFNGDWINKVEFWRPAGVLQCLPIFSMALSCQTQLFEIYQVVHNPSLEKMNLVIKNAVNICTLVYFFVGFFGYIAFASKNFTGNILLSFAPSLWTNIIKLGFILSVAFSFPLVIFPCRASVHSLIYRQGVYLHEGTSNYIPEGRFKGLTLIIVFVSLVIGILIPNIEFVLGLVGSSLGIMICVLFPVTCFIYISEKDTNERLLAKMILVIGLVLMILGTYENLHHLETIQSSSVVTNIVTEKSGIKVRNFPAKDIDIGINLVKDPNNLDTKIINHSFNQTQSEILIKVTNSPEIRHEPPQPMEPQDSRSEFKVDQARKQSNKISDINPNLEIKSIQKINIIDGKKDETVNSKISEKQENIIQSLKRGENAMKTNVDSQINFIDDSKSQFQARIQADVNNHPSSNFDKIKNDDVDIEAIEKDDKETFLEQKIEMKDSHLEEHQILMHKIQKQNEVQEEIVKQQKKLIEAIEKQQDQKVNEEKLKAEIKAVKEIETIALKAIEKISGDAMQNEQIVADMEKDVLQKVITKDVVENNNHNNNITQEHVKIEELKLMNSLLSAKIKENNITQKPINEIKRNNVYQNSGQIFNQESKPFDTGVSNNNLHNEIESINKTNKQNNTVPLLANLGQNIINETNGSPNKDLLPLPMAVSYLQQQNANFSDSSNTSMTKNSNNFEGKINIVEAEDVKALRRDILGYVTTN